MYLGLVVTVGSEQSLLQGLLLDPESSCASASLVGCPLRGQFPSSVFPLSSHTDEDSHDRSKICKCDIKYLFCLLTPNSSH